MKLKRIRTLPNYHPQQIQQLQHQARKRRERQAKQPTIVQPSHGQYTTQEIDDILSYKYKGSYIHIVQLKHEMNLLREEMSPIKKSQQKQQPPPANNTRSKKQQ